MSKTVKIKFQIFENGEKDIKCDKSKPISHYKDELLDKLEKDDKFKTYVFATEKNAYINDQTLCKDIINCCVCFRPNGSFPIKINFFNDGEDKLTKELTFKFPLTSTVEEFKDKLKMKLKGKDLNLDEIKVKYGEEKELNEDDYIFSYKEDDDFEINVIIPKHIEENEKFFFKFPDDKIYGFELDPDKTFKQINKMDDFKKYDYSFFIKDSQINNNSTISEYDEAKNESTPIQLKIKYCIKVTYEGSNSVPEEYLHPFASDQKVNDVLDEFARVVKERRKLSYNEKEMDEQTQLSEIKYKKGTAFDIIILPAEYSFMIEGTKEEFKLRLNGDITIKKLIRKIQKDKDIKFDLEIYTGSKIDPHKHEENETVSEIKESEKIIVKKVDPLYKITFEDELSEKRLDVKWTVSDLLKSNKKYKSPNERQKMVIKHKDKILPDDSLLCDLYPRKISIELLEPVYQFQFKDLDPISISIPDDTEYNEAIDIVKEHIDDIKEKETERIEFQLEGITFNFDTKFGPDIPQENPIVVNILNPEYNWTVKENEDDVGKEMEFNFPEEFTISDAIKEIEKKFKYKCSVIILKKSGKGKSARLIPLKNDTNMYRVLYNIKIQVYVQKCPPKFKFATDSEEFEKEFDNNDKVGQIIEHLRLKKNKLSFSNTDDDDDAELNDRIEFEYKGKEIDSTETFDSLNYQPYEEDKIKVKLLPPYYYVYSPKKLQKSRVQDGGEIKLSDIEVLKGDNDNLLTYQNFRPLASDDTINFENYSSIDYFVYQKKVGFKFEENEIFIYINDYENITINEVKTLVLPQINEGEINYGPERICLNYNNKEIKNEDIKSQLFKDIDYEEGKFIDISIKNKVFNVKINDEVVKYDLDDDHLTIGDLQEKIKQEKSFTMKYRNKQLKKSQKLTDLHLSKKDFIEVEFKKTKTLSYDGTTYKLDGLDLKNVEELKEHFRNVFEIDVDNSTFKCNKKPIKLEDFCNLDDGAEIILTKIETKKFKNFDDENKSYNGKFDTCQTIGDVRKSIRKKNSEGLPILIYSGEKLLLDSVKLFQVQEKIRIDNLDGNRCKKTFKFEDSKDNKLEEEYFDFDTYGKDLKAYVGAYVFYNFDLLYDGKVINDDDRICEIGEEITIRHSKDGEDAGREILFKFEDNKDETFYSKGEDLAHIQEKLKHKCDAFFRNGKLLPNNKPIDILEDEDIPTIFAFQSKDDKDLYNQSAKCVLRVEKPELKITEIIVDDASKAVSDNPEEGQIKINYTKDIKTVFDLRRLVAQENGFNRGEVDLVSLFIPYSTKEGTDFALLNDNEQIIEIISENPTRHFTYKIINEVKSFNQKMLKRYLKVAKENGLEMTGDEIKNIYKRTGGNLDSILATIYYIASKKE